MSKKWMYLFVLAVLVIPMILTACGPTPEPTQAPEPTEAAPEPTAAEVAPEPTEEPKEPEVAAGPYEDVDPTGATVLWWHQHTKEREEGLQEMVAEFNETNEWGITVQAEYAGGYSEIYDKMIAAIAANDPTLMPNLTVGYANQVAKYQLSEALVDMDYFVDSAKWGLTDEEIADFPTGIFEADVSPVFGDGHFRMGFPPNRSMEVMYYNQDWLTELGYDGPPETWAEFAEMVCAATDPDAGTVGYEISTDASRFASLVFSRHGTYFLEDGSAFDFTNDTVNETMSFMKDLYDQGCITLIAESYGDQTDFGNYKTLFTIGSTSGINYYDSAVKSGEQGEFLWGVAPLPYMDGGDEPVMNLYGASVSVPVTTPEQELAAWLFVKWFTEPEQNARWAKISGYFPTRISAADAMADYMEANPVYAQGFELMPYSTYEAQWCACYEEVRRLMEESYSAILDGADIDATLAQLEEDANVSLFENTPEGWAGPVAPVAPTAVPEPTGPYEDVDPTGAAVLWWHQHTKEREEGLQEMVTEFNETNEWGITVQAEYAGGYSEIYDKMIAAIAANDPTLMPNLTVGYANQVAKYQLSEALVDMDYFVDSAKWGLTDEEIADFPQGILEADVSPVFGDGHFRMGWPPNRSMEVMYYNQDWLTELGYDGPPKTWAEFAEMACAASDPDAGTIGYEISTDASRFASMVFSRHGTYFFEDGSAFDFLNDTVVETMTFMKDLYDQGCIGLMAESYGDQTDFGNYKCLFTIGSTSGINYYDSAVKSGEAGEFVWGVAPLPYMDGGDEPVMNLYGASVSVPVTTPEQELAAWLFVKWFTEPEQNARWAKISGYFPPRISAAEAMTDFMEANPVYAQGFELMPYSTYEAQWCACYEEVRRLMEESYSAILDGADIVETLTQLQEDANVSLAENTP